MEYDKEFDIVDGNSWGYAAHGAQILTAGDLQTQAIFGFVKSVRELQVRHPKSSKIVLWDGRKEERFEILPEYKGNRDDDPVKEESRNHYVEARPYISMCLEHLGVKQTTCMNLEADDMAGYLVGRLARNPRYKIRLWTGDGDWKQLVRPNVTWIDQRDDSRVITWDTFHAKTGYHSPLSFLEGKCLQGDSSDCIPGVGGVGAGRAPLILAQFGSMKEFWRRCDAGEYVPRLKFERDLAAPEARAKFLRNLKLMQLMSVPTPAKEKLRTFPGKYDPKALTELFEELAFASLLKDMTKYLRPFNN